MKISKQRQDELTKFQNSIKYNFKSQFLINKALTHSSYANEHKDENVKDNERLEFLGDAILDLIVSEYLFKKYPEAHEGDLSKYRASIVCESGLAKAGRDLNIGDYILLGKGEKMSGGNDRSSIIADAFEAVTGAMFMDSSFEDVRIFLANTLIESVRYTTTDKLYQDYKTILQVEAQKNNKNVLVYDIVEEKGPDHDKEFVVELKQNGEVIGSGSGKTKREAEQIAAHMALKNVYKYTKE
ncbi:MAG: ribonuclease III [Epulopiscium sp. Nuni2H_MBin003]|nr:MAG: ribonuclease III [Epulopiscium sp. Nuni2H_MBin003]